MAKSQRRSACGSGRKHFIVIQSLTSLSEDAHGHVDRTDDSNWTTYETAYATVVSKAGREFWKVNQVRSDITHVWRMPYSTKLGSATSDMRVKHDGKVYNIVWAVSYTHLTLPTNREV